MQVTFENLDKVNVLAHLSIPASDVSPIYKGIVVKYKQNARVPGFRQGKCPERLIISKYAAAINEEVAEKLIDSAIKQAFNEEGFSKCVSRPNVVKIGEIKPDCDFNFDVQFEVFPEYEAKPLSEIEVEKVSFSVSDEDVDNMIKVLREQNATFTQVEGDVAVEDKHFVNIKFVGKIDGEAFQGGTAEDFRVEMAAPQSMIPGFIEQIKGHKVGETFNIEATFPEGYGHDLDGKTAVFETTINSISERTLPSDEELCKKLETESMEALKKALRTNIAREGEFYCSKANWAALTVALAKANEDCEVPPSVIEATKQSMVDSQVEYLKRNMFGINSEPNNKQAKMIDGLRQHMLENISEQQAKDKALQNHFVREYYVSEKIQDALTSEVLDKGCDDYLQVEASAYEDAEGYIKEVKGNKADYDRVRTIVENNMVLEHLLSKMKTTVNALTFEEISKRMQLDAMRSPF